MVGDVGSKRKQRADSWSGGGGAPAAKSTRTVEGDTSATDASARAAALLARIRASKAARTGGSGNGGSGGGAASGASALLERLKANKAAIAAKLAAAKAEQAAATTTTTAPTGAGTLEQQQQQQDEDEDDPFYDPRMARKARSQKRRTFNFNEPGEWSRRAEGMRGRLLRDYMDEQIREQNSAAAATDTAAAAGGGEYANLFADEAADAETRAKEPVPGCEWWDLPLLPRPTVKGAVRVLSTPSPSLRAGVITDLVQHPVPTQPLVAKPAVQPQPLKLTKKEQRKFRKKTRAERLKKEAELVQWGLAEAPAPKLKISNMMQVMATSAISDPTQLEAAVRAQIAERRAKHVAANKARMLTKEERRAKKLRKLDEDSGKGIHAVVFQCDSLQDTAKRHKVEVMAHDYRLSGCILYYPQGTLIIAEGGPKFLRKFAKRVEGMKWGYIEDDVRVGGWQAQAREAADTAREAAEAAGGDARVAAAQAREAAMAAAAAAAGAAADVDISQKRINRCVRLWNGTQQERRFVKFRHETFPSVPLAKAYLEQHGAAHLLDMAGSVGGA